MSRPLQKALEEQIVELQDLASDGVQLIQEKKFNGDFMEAARMQGMADAYVLVAQWLDVLLFNEQHRLERVWAKLRQQLEQDDEVIKDEDL